MVKLKMQGIKSIVNKYNKQSFRNIKNANNTKLLSTIRKYSSVNSQIKKDGKNESHSMNINSEKSLHSDEIFDTVIVGGGVTGTSLLFLLSKFTNLKKLALIERRENFSMVASHGKNNSQTIHCGDIETNYTLEKAKRIKRHADILRNYLTKLPKTDRENISAVGQKMVIGVGEKECQFIEERFPIFNQLFKKMQLYNIENIRDVEPNVALKDAYTLRDDKVNALYMPPELTTCDYQKLSISFVNSSQNTDKKISINLLTEVIDIEEINDTLYKIHTDKGTIKARFVIVCACGHSLLIAQKMNYGLQYSCLPVAGSFYFTDKILNGKVYTIQNPILPFAAVHGDPDIIKVEKTRFGPTALPLPLLERDNKKTIKDFLKVWNPDFNLLRVYLNLLGNYTMLEYAMKNFLFEIPILNKYLFLKDVKKIIPSLTKKDLTYCVGYGGVRPQLIDKKTRKLLLGEGKIDSGKNIIFNITPSPGATTCLGNGEIDMNTICKRLNAEVNKKQVMEFLYKGEYPIDYL